MQTNVKCEFRTDARQRPARAQLAHPAELAPVDPAPSVRRDTGGDRTFGGRRSHSAAPLVHVVDDDDASRLAVLALLDASGFEASGYATAGHFLLHPLPDRPSCLLLELHMPGPSGLDLQSALERMGMALPIVFLTARADIASSVQAMKSGAIDVLQKPVARDALFDALQRALARATAQRDERGRAEELKLRFAALAPRERRVLADVVAGRLNKQIAEQLGIVERTVKLIRAQVMTKVGANSLPELVRFAERLSQVRDL